MSLLTLTGRIAIATAVRDKADSIYLAWGSGDSAWDTTPVDVDDTLTELEDEVGRRLLTYSAFVVEDDEGEIVTPSGSYTISANPTTNLFMRFAFDTTDSPSAIIREVGLFTDGTVNDGLPPGQKYFSPAEVDDPGIMAAVERFTHFTRSPDVRQTFEFVWPF
jgi:hypothetical protein